MATAVLLVACGTPSATSPAASITPSPAEPAGSAHIPTGWVELNLADAGPTHLAGVVANPDGFVVFGSVGPVPTVWTSPDGLEWVAARLPGFDVAPSQAVASDDGIVLLGQGSTDECARSDRAFVWVRSRGEVEWIRAAFNELFCAGGFARIATNGGRVVVAGTGTGEQPFAWVSDDGLTWRDGTPGLDLDAPLWRLTATDEDFLVLSHGAPMSAYASPTGAGWRLVGAPPVLPPPNGLQAWALLSTPLGVFAFVGDEDAVPFTAWRRDVDGSWTELEILGLGPGDFLAGGFVIDGHPYLLVHRNGEGRVLTSEDLETWLEVPVPKVGSIAGMATHAGRTVLVASVFEPIPQMGLGEFVVYVSDPEPEVSGSP